MKWHILLIVIFFCLVYSGRSQDSFQSSEVEEDSQELPENPFVSDGEESVSADQEQQTDTLEAESNPFLTQAESENETEMIDESGKRGVDLLLDIGIGINLTQFAIKPEDITTEGKANFLFNAGVLVPFGRYFYASLAVRYLRLSVEFSIVDTSFDKILDDYVIMITSTESNEAFTFISAPVKLGMRFEVKRFTPYFNVDFEPAYLTASSQTSETDVNHKYSSGYEFDIKGGKKDTETTKYRERHQIFLGAGIGLEMSYGYGYIYIESGWKKALFDTDEPGWMLKSRPARKSGSVYYIPISFGVRFFL